MDDVREPLTTYEQLAKMIDHALVRPDLNDEQVIEGCQLAQRYDVATVSVRPSDVDLAVGVLEGSDVKVGSVSGFPHGSQNTAVKLYETRDLLRRGAKEIDMVLNIGKLLSRQFHYVENELLQMAETCHEEGALLKVIFENAYLTEELKIVACKIAKRTRVDFVKTSTGFAPSGATMEDLQLMVKRSEPRVKVKAAGSINTLDKALEAYSIGCTRIGSSDPATILDAWKQRLEELTRDQREREP